MKGTIHPLLQGNFIIDMENRKSEYLAIGAMSGTSLDGLDLSLCRYFFCNGQWDFELIDCSFVEYSPEMRLKLKGAYSALARVLVETDIEFGRYIGQQVKKFAQKNKFTPDLVASHGQTIFHSPSEGYTCQIGSGAVVASITGLPVVSDFRQQDVTLGGQGAPLVPIGDMLLFAKYGACLNIGGFANISYNSNNKRVAFDICAVNFVLNRLASLAGKDFDKDGEMASFGLPDKNLLAELSQIAYYGLVPPKSLGQEWADKHVLPMLERYSNIPLQNLLHTYTVHAAAEISKTFVGFVGETVLVTGGGAKNKYLVQKIQEYTCKQIIVPESQITDFKEAIIFGFLGVLRLRGDVNCISSVTGAHKDTSAGALYLP
ncbi:MAG: anhydro-N-acetylmuramic acid kinase [Bacteroidales bacterium]|nr:anhydro-N-acetylmuramic acid kinase [Bacteroidales bacterium]